VIRFFKTGIFLLFISNIATLLNYLYLTYLSRVLPKDEFSIYTAITSMSPLLFSFFGVVPYLYILIINDNNINDTERIKLTNTMNFGVLCLSFLIVIMFLFVSNGVSDFLKIDDHVESIILFSFTMLFSFLSLSLVGLGLGHHNYKQVQSKDFILSLTKVCFLVLFCKIMPGTVFIAISSELIGTILSFFFLLYCVKPYFKKLRFREKFSVLFFSSYIRKAIPITLNHMLIGMLLVGDVILARHFLSSDLAADYAVASNLGKVAFYVSAAIVSIIFPMVIKNLNENKNLAPMLLSSIVVCFSAGSSIVAIAYFFPGEVASFFFGRKYGNISDLFFFSSLSMTVFSVNTIFFNFFLASNKYFYLLGSVIGLGFFALFLFSGRLVETGTIAKCFTLTQVFILCYNILFFSHVVKRDKSIKFSFYGLLDK